MKYDFLNPGHIVHLLNNISPKKHKKNLFRDCDEHFSLFFLHRLNDELINPDNNRQLNQ